MGLYFGALRNHLTYILLKSSKIKLLDASQTLNVIQMQWKYTKKKH